jgi:hypothetical protein
MQGRKAQNNASTARITDSGEFDEHALIGDLRRFVEESELSIARKEDDGQMFVHESDSGGWNAFSAILLNKECIWRVSSSAK